MESFQKKRNIASGYQFDKKRVTTKENDFRPTSALNAFSEVSQPVLTCSKLAMEAPDQCVNYVQS